MASCEPIAESDTVQAEEPGFAFSAATSIPAELLGCGEEAEPC